MIVVGTVVTEDGQSSNQSFSSGELAVTRYLKGAGYDQIYFEVSNTTCSPSISTGDTGVFLGHWTSDNKLQIMNSWSLDSEVEVFAITGQSNPTQALPLDMQISRIAEKGELNWLYIPLSILLVFGVILGFWLARRGRRKTKAKREIK